ncbi:MAG: 1-acylglycerol-3-phosphate O-acyltransferase [Bacteriovoracaceae bacterium]
MLELIRIVLATIYICTISLIYLLVFTIRPFHYPWVQAFGRFFGRGGLFILGIKIEGENLEAFDNLPSSVVIGNHQHNIDVFIYSSFFPPRPVSIGKRSILKIPFFGQLYYLTGQILIDRSNKKSAWSSMSVAAKKMIKHSLNVLIFPEGTRSRGRGLLPFKKGPFYLAKEAHRPLQIVLVSDLANGIDLNRWRAGTIKVKVLDPIPVSVIDQHTAEELMSMTREIFEKELSALNKSLNLKTVPAS